MIKTRRWIRAFAYIVLLGVSILSCAPPRYALRNAHSRKTNVHNNHDESVQVEEYSWDNSSEDQYISSEPVMPVQQRHTSHADTPVPRSAPTTYTSSPKQRTRHVAVSSLKKSSTLAYKVKRGDTLFRISQKFHVSVNDLCKRNKIKDVRKIYEGMVLYIPNKKIIITKGTTTTTTGKKYNPASTKKKQVGRQQPAFMWPMKHISKVKRDGRDGVKSIGIVITGSPGSEVLPAAPGKVQKIGYMRGFGNYIVIVHQNRFMTVYANLEKVLVREGARIFSRTSIGRLKYANPLLHFQINKAGKPQNPLALLPKRHKSS